MSLYDKTYKVALNQLDQSEMKYLYLDVVPGLIKTLPHYGLEISQESIDACKQALLDHFNDGCDMEWEREAQWKFWDGLCPEWFAGKGCAKCVADFEA